MSGGRAEHRLLDIVVEEVSLVDRAANKHRFLLVKRDEGEGVDDDDDLNQDDPSGDEPNTNSAPPGPELQVAAKALSSLTDAVEKLSTDGGATKEAVAKVVAELGEAAQQIAKSAGMEPPPAPPAEGATLEGVRATLAQVRAVLDGGKPPELPAPATKSAPGEPSGSPSKLEQLLAQVSALAKGLADQQQLGQRLAQLEKHFGLPNSTSAGERPSGVADEDDDDGWSLDLNRPVDRESVDKSVSFHDL